MQNKKLFVTLLIVGGVLIIGGRFFLYRSLVSDGNELQADVIQQDTTTDQQVPQFDAVEDNTKIPDNNEDASTTNPSEEDLNKESISLDEAIEDTGTPLAPIRVIVPPHIDTDALESLRKEIYKTHRVLVDFEQNRTFQAYEEAIREQKAKPTADIILIPSNWFDSYTQRGIYIPTEQPLSPLFHPAVKSLVEHKESTFIPFSLDPYITVYDDNLPLQTHITIGNIQQQLLTLLAKESHQVPLGFGITAADLFLLEQEKQAYPEYTDILQLILGEAAYSRNTYIIEYFLEAGGWDTTTAVKTARGLQGEDIACMTLAHLCLLKHSDMALGFSRMSNLALAAKLFNWTYSEQYKIGTFPVNTSHYPLTTRGFVVNQESEHLDSTIAWLRGYLEHAGFGNMPLRTHTLSAFNNVFKQQKIQDPYVQLLQEIDSFYIVQGHIDSIKELAQDKKLQSMLAGDYSKIIYIKERLADQEETKK